MHTSHFDDFFLLMLLISTACCLMSFILFLAVLESSAGPGMAQVTLHPWSHCGYSPWLAGPAPAPPLGPLFTLATVELEVRLGRLNTGAPSVLRLSDWQQCKYVE